MSLGEATINVRVKMASVKAEMDKAKSEIEAAGKDMDKPAKSFTDSWNAAKSTILPIVAGIGTAIATMKKAIEFTKEGAQIDRLAETSASLAKSMDLDMNEIMTSIRDASLGMVSDYDIMQSASRAMMLGVGGSAEQMGQLMEVAAVRGRAMGLSTTQAFNDIVTGIGRASPMILDNLGIVIDADSTYKAYADAIGKAGSELSKAEKTQALLNAVLESSQALLAETGGLTMDYAGTWEYASAQISNYFDRAKRGASDGVITRWAEDTGRAFEGMNIDQRNKEIIEYAHSVGLMSDAEYMWSQVPIISTYESRARWAEILIPKIEDYTKKTKESADATQDWVDANYEGSGAISLMAESQARGALEVQRHNEELAKQKENYEKVFGVTSNFSAITRLASDYTTQLKNITTAQERIAALEPFKDTGGVLDGVAMSAKEVNDELEKQKELIEAAQEAMTRSANQMALDMFANSIAIDGVTEGEMQAYFDMAVQMGFVSREAADMAMQAWRDAVETLNGNPAKPEVIVDIEEAKAKIRELLKIDITPINIPVTYNVSTMGQIPTFAVPLPRADGGPVARGNPYWVGERGVPELFIPQENGQIVNQDTIMQALSNTTNNTTTTSNVYNLHANYGYQNPLSLIEQVKVLNLLGST